MRKKPVVLFLCSQNSARSQMAEGLLREMAGDRFEAHSAGTNPGELNPLAVRAMQETGIDISGQRAKGAGDIAGHLLVDYLVVVCSRAAESCPTTTWLGARRREVWPFPDPAQAEGTDAERLQVFGEVRDAIRERLAIWISEVEQTHE